MLRAARGGRRGSGGGGRRSGGGGRCGLLREARHAGTARSAGTGLRLRSGDQALADRGLAGLLAGAADSLGLLTRLAHGGLLVGLALLHLAEDALALHLLLEDAERLIDVVIANEYLQRNQPLDLSFRTAPAPESRLNREKAVGRPCLRAAFRRRRRDGSRIGAKELHLSARHTRNRFVLEVQESLLQSRRAVSPCPALARRSRGHPRRYPIRKRRAMDGAGVNPQGRGQGQRDGFRVPDKTPGL
ncbi:protein of unknown function [Methylorubrum extorquens]|uniref:Uncharacterized protein n=1 Tax=Methylorubrum extorquens TaxID=408 RepID=A0A2N9ALV9_METEX|nr:protein of unknown function [Methylorubrum extorquens]